MLNPLSFSSFFLSNFQYVCYCCGKKSAINLTFEKSVYYYVGIPGNLCELCMCHSIFCELFFCGRYKFSFLCFIAKNQLIMHLAILTISESLNFKYRIIESTTREQVPELVTAL